ncbi:MAG TPA: hypothetical protein VL282_04200, partial [Tepidisphaeraceae bacterium]|nr:hypothetical protein [Tepidisphaeraceae bacterium]
MPTRVESGQTKSTDLLKTLQMKQTDSSSESAQPFKKELARAQKASERPKADQKDQQPEAKKASRADKKGEIKAKKQVKPREADD